MSNPNIDAKNGRAQDARNPVASCPLKKDKIQLIPVRYGLVEKNVDEPAICSSFQSMISFRSIGLRPIAENYYLYLIHSHRSDIIYCYQIKADGRVQKLEQQKTEDGRDGKEFVYQESESTLVVKRMGQLYALLSYTPISAKLQGVLLTSDKYRKKMMQSCDLNQYNCISGAPHLLPPSKLSACLADQHPLQSDNDYFSWCWEKESPKETDSAVLLANIQNEYQDDAAILLLDEPITLMNELSSAYMGLEAAEELWLQQDNNAEKLFAASQLTTLMSVGKSQLQSAAKKNDAFQRYMSSLHNEQEVIDHFKEYSDLQQRYAQANLNASLDRFGRSEHYAQRDKIEEAIAVNTEKLNDLSEKIQIKSSDLFHIFEQARRDNIAITEGINGYRGLNSYIDENEMAKWYDNASTWLTAHQSSLQQIEQDRVNILPQAYQRIPFFDKSSKDRLCESLTLQNNWLYNIAATEASRQTLRQFFFQQLGEQNLQIYHLSEDDKALIKTYLENGGIPTGDINNALGVVGGAMATSTDEDTFTELQAFLTHRGLIELDPSTFNDAIRRQIDRLGLNLNALVLEEINTLTLNLSKGAALNTTLSTIPLGLKAIILGQRNNRNVTIKIRATNTTPASLDNLNRIVADYAQLETTLKRNLASAVTQSDKDSFTHLHRQKINELKVRSRNTLNTLMVESFPSSGRSNIRIDVGPEDANTLMMIEKEYRKALSNQILYGQNKSPRSATDIAKASPLNLTSPLGGASLSCLFLWVGVLNFNSTMDSFKEKNDPNRYQYAELIGDSMAMLSSAIATTAGVLALPVMFKEAQTGTPLWGKLGGQLNTFGITFSSALTFLASIGDGMKQFGRLQSSLKKEDNIASIGSAMALTGDGLQLFGSGAITFYGRQQIMAAMRGTILWSQAGVNTFGFALRLNWLMLAAAGLVFIGELFYNMSQSTPLGRWARDSWWGNNNKKWPQDEQLYQWMKAVQQPQCSVMTEDTSYTTTVPYYQISYSQQASSYREIEIKKRNIKALKLVIPMVDPVDIRLAAKGQKNGGEWVDLTKTLVNGATITSEGYQTRYEFEWPQSKDKQELFIALDLVVRVKVQISPTITRWLNEEQGTRFSLSFSTIKKLKDSDKAEFAISPLENNDLQASTPTEFITLMSLQDV
ncbi:toxin VasX [Photobacterium damselae]|uniref:toxin VasX n=1 Tax=Photobacterium damselae TaxID=38293 RepID=UPI0025428F4B